MTQPSGATRLAPLGLLLAAATLAVLETGVPDFGGDTTAPPALAILGLALLGVAGLIGRRRGSRRLPLAVALAVPGAALVGLGGDLPGPGWLAVAAAATAAVGGPLAADADRRWARVGGAPIGFAVSAIGLYGCVPDTEEAKVLLAVALVAAALSRLPTLRVLGAPGAMVTIGLFAWIAAFDARGRPAAFVGAAGALALLALEPIGARLRGARRPLVRDRGAVVVVLLSQVALVAYASRVAGLEHSVWRAVLLLAPALGAGVVVGVVAGHAVARAPTRARTA